MQKAMQELSYVPNSSAQRLRGQKTNTVAVIISRIINPFFSHLVDAMGEAATDRGYQLLLCDSRLDAQRELEHLELLKKKQVDGVILASLQNTWKEIEPYTKFGPVITCNEYDKEAEMPMISCDQQYGGYLAVRHLIEQGHTRIAYAGGVNRIQLTYDRLQGYRQAMAEASLPVEDAFIFTGIYGLSDGIQVFDEIRGMEEPPTAIFAGGDEVAAGVIKQAKLHQWRVPEDIAVVGFDNQPLAELVEPGITTIEQPTKVMGIRAMQLMMDMIDHAGPVTYQKETLPLHLVKRGST